MKPGGEDVYPVEVEMIVWEHPELVEVSIIGVPDWERGEAVKAICLLKPGSCLTEKELTGFVGSRIGAVRSQNL